MNYADFKQRANFIPDDPINQAIAEWHKTQPERHQETATPSSLTDCPRAVWLKYKKKVPITNERGWGMKQRLLLGRNFENFIAKQLDSQGLLLWHWADNFTGESVKFKMGEGLDRIEGTPDLLLKFNNIVYISDAKTGRSDGYGYVPTDDTVWDDYFWYKYKLQITAYYLLCHANKQWFEAQLGMILPKDKTPDFPVTTDFPGLPLPEACHLFSFSLDDGIVRRSITWRPSTADAEAVLKYTRRWNAAFASETMPPCTCETDGGGKAKMFCSFGYEYETTKKGKQLVTKCCKGDLDV